MGEFKHSFLKKVLFLAIMAISLGSAEPVNIIYDSDFGPDCDDVGGLALLHHFEDIGLAKVLGMGNSTTNPDGPATMDAINHFYKRPDLPIGVFNDREIKPTSWYTVQVSRDFPNDVGKAHQVPNTTEIYRRILANVPDNSVKFVVVGFKVNMVNLINSPPDSLSPLTGLELVNKKVIELVDMGGAYPTGHEYNFFVAGYEAQVYLDKWPTKMIFSGFEVGQDVMTGAMFQTGDLWLTNPVAASYKHWLGEYGETGRSSWDLIAAYYAVKGLDNLWTLSDEGCNTANSEGGNSFSASNKCNHFYMKKKAPVSVVSAILDSLMLETPNPSLPSECLDTVPGYQLADSGACQVFGTTCRTKSGVSCQVHNLACYVEGTKCVSSINPIDQARMFQVVQNSSNFEISFNSSSPSSSLEVHDLNGKVVATLYQGSLREGPHTFIWNGTSSHGEYVQKGVYLIRLVNDGRSQVHKVFKSR
ncbi:MAG: T9SS type A sorting domain-containing protein [Fibrobacteria bacterium]|nr:T9SS type A sorting domain-containing protein [Fibrobacteria bacterium]